MPLSSVFCISGYKTSCLSVSYYSTFLFVPFDQIMRSSFKPPPASTNFYICGIKNLEFCDLKLQKHTNTQEELILLQNLTTKLVRPATQLEPNYFPPKLLGGDTGAEGVGMLPFLLCRQGR